MDLFDLFVKLGLDDDGFTAGLKDTMSKLSSFKDGVTGAVGGAVSATVTAVKAVGDAIAQGTSQLAQYGDAIDKTSQKMGISAEAYQEWDAVMQHSGTSMDTLKAGMRTLATAAEKNSEAFEKLGMTQEEVASMSREELFSATIEALQNVQDENERTVIATQLLGRGAMELGALLNTSAEDTQAMKDRVHELGGVMSDEAVKASALFQDNLQDLNTAIDGVKRGIYEQFLPGLNLLMEGFTSLIVGEEQAEGKLTQGFEKIAEGFEKAVDKIEPIAKQLIPRIVEFAVRSLPKIAQLSIDIVNTLVNTILDNLHSVVDAAGEIVLSASKGISDMLPELMPAAVEVVLEVVNSILDNLDKVIDTGIELIDALLGGITQSIPKLIEKAPELISKFVVALANNVDKVLEIPPKIIKAIADGLVNVDWTETAEAMMDGLVNALDAAQKRVQIWIDNAVTAMGGQSLYNGDINNVQTTEFIKNLDENKGVVVDAISGVTGAVKEGYDAYYGTVDESNKKISAAHEETIVEMSDYGKSLQAQSENWKKASAAFNDTVTEVVEDQATTEEQIKEHFKKLETQMYESGLSEEWLVHQKRNYIELLDHNTDLYKDYNLSLLKEEDKITKQADTEFEKRIKASNEQKKTAVEKAFAQFEKEALINNYTEEWLVKQEREYIEALDHSSELYEEYNMKILRSEKKINDEIAAQRKKDAEERKKAFEDMIKSMISSAKSKIEEYEKVIDNIKSQISSFAKSLTKSFSDMFSFDVDEETGKMTATKTKQFMTQATQQLENYYDNIIKLRERGASEALLNQLTTMDTDKGSATAEYLMSLTDEQLKNMDRMWSKYEAASQKVSEALYSDEMQAAEKELDETRNTLLGEIITEIDSSTGHLIQALTGMKAGETVVNVNGIQYQSLEELTTGISQVIELQTRRAAVSYGMGL